MIEITVNNEKKELKSGCTVAESLSQLKVSAGPGIAVAINMEVIPSSQWAQTKIRSGDNLTILRAAQGG